MKVDRAIDVYNRNCKAFAPLEKLLPSEWAERYRVLSNDNAVPGPYSFDLTPYWREVIDQFANAEIEEIVVIKSAQVGFSTIVQNLLGWIADNEPAPVLAVMPTAELKEKLIKEDVTPLIQNCEQLQRHHPIIRKKRITFDTCSIHLASACSPSSLASRHIRFVFLDEVDKYPRYAGKDADPVSLAIRRTTTFQHRRKVMLGSTPTTRDAHITTWWEGCTDKRFYHVPCPFCGFMQPLTFAAIQFGEGAAAIEDKQKRADFIEQKQSAYYQCCNCKGAIRDIHKPAMLRKGRWVSTATAPSKRVGYHIDTLYSYWVTFSQIAAQFLRCQTPAQLMEFRNQWLGEAWEDVAVKADASDLQEQLKTAPPSQIVPDWASVLTTAVDCQQDHYFLTVRAWSKTKTQLVTAAKLPTFDDVYRVGLQTFYSYANGKKLSPVCLLIDSGGTGDMTKKVYDFARRDNRILPVKGMSKPSGKKWTYSATADGTTFALIDTNYYKDNLARYRKDGLWLINRDTPEDYFKHLAAEHKVRHIKTGRLIWKPINEQTPNHYLDCEVYQLAASEITGVANLPDETVTPTAATAIAPKRQIMVTGLYD